MKCNIMSKLKGQPWWLDSNKTPSGKSGAVQTAKPRIATAPFLFIFVIFILIQISVYLFYNCVTQNNTYYYDKNPI